MKLILGQRFLNKWTPPGMGHKWNWWRFCFSNWSFIEWDRGLFSKGHVSDTEISFSPFTLSNFIQAFVSWLCRSSKSITEFRFILHLGTIIIFFNKVIIFRITYNSNKTRTHTKKLVFSWLHPYHICLRYRTNDDDPLFYTDLLQKSDTVFIFSMFGSFFHSFRIPEWQFLEEKSKQLLWNFCSISAFTLCLLSSVVPLLNSFDWNSGLPVFILCTDKKM